jgi:hypothetical protein
MSLSTLGRLNPDHPTLAGSSIEERPDERCAQHESARHHPSVQATAPPDDPDTHDDGPHNVTSVAQAGYFTREGSEAVLG